MVGRGPPYGQAIELRHLEVHEDEVGALLVHRGLHRLDAARRADDLDAAVAQERLGDERVDVVVFGDQHPVAGKVSAWAVGDRCVRLLDERRVRGRQRSRELELGADADDAFERHVTAHRAGKLARDGQAQPRSRFALGRLTRLTECLEHRRVLQGGDPQPGVSNREDGLARLAAADAELDPAALGELDGVAEKVVQDLANPGRVADDPAMLWNARIENEGDRRRRGSLGVEV